MIFVYKKKKKFLKKKTLHTILLLEELFQMFNNLQYIFLSFSNKIVFVVE